jgi:hypothetical protein
VVSNSSLECRRSFDKSNTDATSNDTLDLMITSPGVQDTGFENDNVGGRRRERRESRESGARPFLFLDLQKEIAADRQTVEMMRFLGHYFCFMMSHIILDDGPD